MLSLASVNISCSGCVFFCVVNGLVVVNVNRVRYVDLRARPRLVRDGLVRVRLRVQIRGMLVSRFLCHFSYRLWHVFLVRGGGHE